MSTSNTNNPIDIAVTHTGTDPDTLASAYVYSILYNIPYIVADTINPAVHMIVNTYIVKKPIDIDGSKTYRLHLLDFHSSSSLHEKLINCTIDTIIDHHLEGDLQADTMVIDPIGATSTLVYEMLSCDPSTDMALLTGFGICDDTAGGILHATERDLDILKQVQSITGKDIPWFMKRLEEAYIEGFKVDFDARTYNIGGYIIVIGQFRAPGALGHPQIMTKVSQWIDDTDGDLVLYIVSDSRQVKSTIIGKGKRKELSPLLDKLTGNHPLISRKVDILPAIKTYIKTMGR